MCSGSNDVGRQVRRVGLGGGLLLAGLLLTQAGNAMKTQNITLVVDLAGVEKEVVLNIQHKSEQVEITYFNEFGDKEIIFFQNPKKPLACYYYNPKRELVARSIFDYEKNKLVIDGSINVEYELSDLIYDNNGALLYLFSFYYPPPGESLTLKLVQSNLYRVQDPFLRFLISRLVGPVPMIFRYLRSESLNFNGKNYETDCYELSVKDPALGIFWPYKYYFWYTRQERLLVKQQGMSADKVANYYFLTDYSEWDSTRPPVPVGR